MVILKYVSSSHSSLSMVKKSETCREDKNKVSRIKIKANFDHLEEKYSFFEFSTNLCIYIDVD